MFLKGFTEQHAQEREIIFIQYLCPSDTRKKRADRAKSDIEQFFDLEFAATVKT